MQSDKENKKKQQSRPGHLEQRGSSKFLPNKHSIYHALTKRVPNTINNTNQPKQMLNNTTKIRKQEI